MPLAHASRNAFVARIDRRRRLAYHWVRAQRKLGVLRKPHQAAIYDATFQSDAEVVSYFYAKHNDHLPDFDHPLWINEKIRWQFLHHPNPLMSLVADKISVRDYLRHTGVETRAPEIFATGTGAGALPARLPPRFVLKSAYGSGQNLVVDGSAPVSREKLARAVAEWEAWDQWRVTGEFHYRDLPKRWLIEEYLPATTDKLEYKVFCTLGEPIFISAITERGCGWLKRAYYDPDWNRCDFDMHVPGVITETRPVPRPPELDLMLADARRLSGDFLNVRVDFLKFDGQLAFSELTFASLGARAPYEPREVNIDLGARMDLAKAPELMKRGRRIAAQLGWTPGEAAPQAARSFGWTRGWGRATRHLWPTQQATSKYQKAR